MSGEAEVKAEFIMPVAELAKGAELNFSLADAPRKAGADKVKANGGVTVLQKDLAAGLDFSLKGSDRFGADAFAVFTAREKVLVGVSGSAVVGGKDEKDEKKARASEFSGNVQVLYKSGATLLGAQTDIAKKNISGASRGCMMPFRDGCVRAQCAARRAARSAFCESAHKARAPELTPTSPPTFAPPPAPARSLCAQQGQ